MTQIKADTSSIQSSGNQLGQHVTDFGGMLDAVTKTVSGLGDVWQGKGHDSFANFMVDWNQSASHMHQLLDDVHKNVKQTATSFEDLDVNISKGFKI